MKISEEVAGVLSALAIDCGNVSIVEQLDRKLYVEVNKVLEALGGKWNRKAKVHVFENDPTDALSNVIETRDVVTARDLDFFETPIEVAMSMVRQIGVEPGMSVLEPSAGHGALVHACVAKGANVTAVELDRGRCEKLRRDFAYGARGKLGEVSVIEGDFAKINWRSSFDRVVMNPPFSRRMDIAHVFKAFDRLKPGGRLIAIMSAGINFRRDQISSGFRYFVANHNGRIDPLPEGTFREEGTGVNTVVVEMTKGKLDGGSR